MKDVRYFTLTPEQEETVLPLLEEAEKIGRDGSVVLFQVTMPEYGQGIIIAHGQVVSGRYARKIKGLLSESMTDEA